MELLNHFNIALRQLMPNSWRIVISYMEIWLATTEGDMIKVDEFTYLYRLKDFKEYGYYKLMPWVREARIVPRLLRRWGVSSLGASFLYQSFVLHSFAHILSSLTLLFVVLCG